MSGRHAGETSKRPRGFGLGPLWRFRGCSGRLNHPSGRPRYSRRALARLVRCKRHRWRFEPTPGPRRGSASKVSARPRPGGPGQGRWKAFPGVFWSRRGPGAETYRQKCCQVIGYVHQAADCKSAIPGSNPGGAFFFSATFAADKSDPMPTMRWPRSQTKTALYFLTALLIALLAGFPELYKPMHSDYSMWLRVARDWAGGLKLYEETYDNKQPTIFLFIRLIDCANPKLSLYIAFCLLAAFSAVVLRAALSPTSATCGWAAPLVLIMWSANYATSMGGQSTESLALWFDVIALACFTIAIRKDSAPVMVCAGLSFFVLISLRIPGLLHGIAYLPLVVNLFRHKSAKRAFWLLSAFM